MRYCISCPRPWICNFTCALLPFASFSGSAVPYRSVPCSLSAFGIKNWADGWRRFAKLQWAKDYVMLPAGLFSNYPHKSAVIVRAPISQERMIYIPAAETKDGVARVIYQSKDGKSSKTFTALDWLAQLVTHIPNKGEQLVRYYGYYSNKSRGLRKKTAVGDELVPALIKAEISTEEFRRNWARLIKKVYHADPLLCPKCSGHMRIISFIEDKETIKKILVHLGLWETRNHDPPPRKVDMHKYIKDLPEIKETVYDDFSQLTPYDDDYSQVAEEQYS
jgi:hypothetical protein